MLYTKAHFNNTENVLRLKKGNIISCTKISINPTNYSTSLTYFVRVRVRNIPRDSRELFEIDCDNLAYDTYILQLLHNNRVCAIKQYITHCMKKCSQLNLRGQHA